MGKKSKKNNCGAEAKDDIVSSRTGDLWVQQARVPAAVSARAARS